MQLNIRCLDLTDTVNLSTKMSVIITDNGSYSRTTLVSATYEGGLVFLPDHYFVIVGIVAGLEDEYAVRPSLCF